jgi:hypothetical protein
MSAPIACVYALTDSADGKVYYVGQTRHLAIRISRLFCQQPSPPLRTWFRRLTQEHRRPVVIILQRCAREALLPAEKRWIRYYLARHEPLLNVRTPKPPEQLQFNFNPYMSFTLTCSTCRRRWDTYRRAAWEPPRYCGTCGHSIRWMKHGKYDPRSPRRQGNRPTPPTGEATL